MCLCVIVHMHADLTCERKHLRTLTHTLIQTQSGGEKLSRANIDMLPAKALKTILLLRDIPFTDCIEKHDFVERVTLTPRCQRDVKCTHTHTHTHTQTDRQTDRRPDIRTDRQTDRQTHTHTHTRAHSSTRTHARARTHARTLSLSHHTCVYM